MNCQMDCPKRRTRMSPTYSSVRIGISIPPARRRGATSSCCCRSRRSRDIPPSLHEPERRRGGERVPDEAHAVPEQNVDLEGVDQLVGEHVVQLGVGAGEGQEHPALQEFGDAAGADADQLRRDVRLLEVGVRGVEDEGDLRLDLMVEHATETAIARSAMTAAS